MRAINFDLRIVGSAGTIGKYHYHLRMLHYIPRELQRGDWHPVSQLTPIGDDMYEVNFMSDSFLLGSKEMETERCNIFGIMNKAEYDLHLCDGGTQE